MVGVWGSASNQKQSFSCFCEQYIMTHIYNVYATKPVHGEA